MSEAQDMTLKENELPAGEALEMPQEDLPEGWLRVLPGQGRDGFFIARFNRV